MASQGAKNFIFLSRSGGQKPALAKFVQEMREKHCRVEIAQCDITDLEMLTKTLASYSSSMPPIKGCFQCSMVLRVSRPELLCLEQGPV
jgi:hypothetical protein